MKRFAIAAALVLLALPARADSGFDNFPTAFKDSHVEQVRPSKGHKQQVQHNHCMPEPIRAMLDKVRSLFGSVQVVSAHRPGARIAGTSKASYHASCGAVDIAPPKAKRQEVIAYLKANWAGGLGTYSCGMSHIHLDVGPRVRFHKCA